MKEPANKVNPTLKTLKIKAQTAIQVQ